MLRWYLSLGGGAGDVWWDFLRDRAAGFIPHLARDLNHKIRIYTCCHCDAVADLFLHNPFIREHRCEGWAPPSREEAIRFSNPIEGYLPLQNYSFVKHHLGYDPPAEPPQIYLSPQEREELATLCRQRPLIVMQPFAGLSDRDGFDAAAIGRTVNDIASLNSGARVVVIGKNHERGHKYATEGIGDFTHPNLINRIDKIGLRLAWWLVSNCDAFIGCHSNLIRAAWDARKTNVCVLPDPLMTSHLPNLDRKYLYGFDYAETKQATYPFEQGGERKFNELDTASIARWSLGLG